MCLVLTGGGLWSLVNGCDLLTCRTFTDLWLSTGLPACWTAPETSSTPPHSMLLPNFTASVCTLFYLIITIVVVCGCYCCCCCCHHITVTVRSHSQFCVDAAYCYRRSSVVCQSVTLLQLWAPQKWLKQWRCHLVEDSGGPKEPSIRWGPDPPCKGETLREKMAAHCKV